MRMFARANAVVELQQRMKLVPMVQYAYASMTCIMLYTEISTSVRAQTLTSSNSNTTRNFCVNATILTQVLSLAVSAEVVILIAKGWKITRPQLHVREHQWIRFVMLLWAASYAILKNALVKHVTVFLIWTCVVFMVWYNSAFNMNMLKYQVAMMRQLNSLDHVRMPVYIKYMLFRWFRGILGLMNDTTNSTWQYGVVVADEALNYCLYVALGYTLRCRRFRSLLDTSVATVAADGASAPSEANRVTQEPQRHAASSSIAPAPPQDPSGAGIGDTPPAPSPTKRKPTLVAVINPDQVQALGTTYHVVQTIETIPPSSTSAKKPCTNE